MSDQLPLEAYWMPYTGNRQFKRDPRIIVAAQDVWFTDDRGRRILDGHSGLWTSGLGHGHPEVSKAVAEQIDTLDFAPPFQFGHPAAFHLAEKLKQLMPGDLNYAFFTNSGSESADTFSQNGARLLAIKRSAGENPFYRSPEGISRRELWWHCGGGIGANRKPFGQSLEVDHLRHTMLPENTFCRGMPEQGAHLAEELAELITLHDASTIAAVIVEPMAGSAGVIPPPVGYLQRLRELCDANDILLIFDEVITGLGRCGAYTGAEAFGVTPDILNLAKQITNGAVPMGAVMATPEIYDTFMAHGGPDYALEFAHGYTYSGHPVACAAGLAALEVLVRDQLPARVAEEAPFWEALLHEGVAEKPHVADVRNYGFAGALTLEAYPGEPMRRPYEVAMRMWEKGFLVRYGGDTIQLAPHFVMQREQMTSLVEALADSLDELA